MTRSGLLTGMRMMSRSNWPRRSHSNCSGASPVSVTRARHWGWGVVRGAGVRDGWPRRPAGRGRLQGQPGRGSPGAPRLQVRVRSEVPALAEAAVGSARQPGPVTLVLSRHVKAGHEQAFEEVLRQLAVAVRAQSGHLRSPHWRQDQAGRLFTQWCRILPTGRTRTPGWSAQSGRALLPKRTCTQMESWKQPTSLAWRAGWPVLASPYWPRLPGGGWLWSPLWPCCRSSR